MTKQLNIMDYVPDAEEAIDAVTSAMGANKNESSEQEPAEAGALVVLPKITSVEIFSKEKGLDPIIAQIRDRVKSKQFDVKTEKGRAEIGSVARQVGVAKQGMVKMAKALTEDWRVKTKAVTSETSRMEKEMDALRDEILKPRDEFLEREKSRVSDRTDRIDQINQLVAVINSLDAMDLVEMRDRLVQVDNLAAFDWHEFKDDAIKAADDARRIISEHIVKKEKYDADQAELAESRKKLAEQAKKDEEARIAKEAREAALASAIKTIEDAGNIPDNYTSGQISVVIDNVNKTFNTTKWEEMGDKADDAYNKVAPILQDKFKAAQKAEADEIERQQQEAETNRLNAIREKLKNFVFTIPEVVTSAQLEAKITTITSWFDNNDWQELKAEAQTAYDAALKSLQDTLVTVKEREDKAEKARQDQIQKDADAAAQKKVDDAAAAKKKIDDAAAENIRIADEKRKNNQAHNAKIIGEVLYDLEAAVQYNPANDDALKSERLKLKMIATAIAAGKVRHVSIKY